MKFKKLSQIAAVLGLKTEEREIEGFSIDSRLVKKGDVFFALKGDHFDGHGFLRDVASKGAVAAVVETEYRGESCGLCLLKVKNVTEALQKLAQHLQELRKQRIVAVTGSVGKTTTKEFIATLLAEKYLVAKTPGNNNSQVGLPLALLNAKGEEDFFVVEMGMSKAGEIRKLTEIAPPEMGVITKIGHAHIEFFPDGIEGIAAAKAEIFSHPKTKWGIVSHQAMGFKSISELKGPPKKTYALEPDKADYVLEEGSIIREGIECSPPLRLPFSETHFYEDFMAAALVARLAGLSWEEIIKGAQKLKVAQMRFERVDKDGIVFINDCYNANPESMEAALKNLPSPSFGAKIIAVLGEMKELGSYSEEGHRKVAHLAAHKVDHLLCYGKGCLPMVEVFGEKGKPVEFFRDLQQLKATLFEISKPGDVVLIKGSNANKLWQVLEA